MDNLKEMARLTKEINQIRNNTTKYREHVEKLDAEINQLEQEINETLDFEKEIQLHEKRDLLPKTKERLHHAEIKEVEEVKKRFNEFTKLSRAYIESEFRKDDRLDKTHEQALKSIKKAYTDIVAYEEIREENAHKISNDVNELGIARAIQGIRGINMLNSNSNPTNILRANPSPLDLEYKRRGEIESPKEFFIRHK